MIQLIGIPSFAGALYPGTDETPAALRKQGIQALLEQNGLPVSNWGDVVLPSYLPRHDIAPVRNWPAPHMVWEAIIKQGSSWFAPEKFNLLLGGDCSIIVGVADYLAKLYGEKLYLLIIDAHVDVVKPEPELCVGAAAMGLWFLTNENLLWQKPVSVDAGQIKVLGCQNPPAETYGITTITLQQLRQNIKNVSEAILASIPEDGRVLIHFDVDVIGKAEMPAAYAPSETGLTIAEAHELLTYLVADPRTIGMEVTEFSALKDTDGSNARSLVRLLADTLSKGLSTRKLQPEQEAILK
ncbi:arginase family protein [Pontibacter sp. KCTC 32443]|uniref:arginase family protein n=1 Tax=Pontibacter TaxID=323449 RepID=UPI00164E6E05|nr:MULTISPECIES: arginase family protein [Pontibacter]MBC5774392.1 arginase family protein [Pontibacter sp. KCTC 32443]